MSTFIAALPMYDWPETRAETDAEWARFRAFFQRAGIDAPQTIVRRNAEMPAGARRHPRRRRQGDRARSGDAAAGRARLRDAVAASRAAARQTCWGPMELGLAEHVQVVGQPSYNGFEGGQGQLYSSAILMRRRGGGRAVARPTARRSSRSTSSAASASPTTASIPCRASLRRRATWKRWAKASTSFPSASRPAAHRASIVAVAEGRADVCAIDCRSWHMAQRHEPAAKDVQVVGWTGAAQGPADDHLACTRRRRSVEKLIEILSPP